jgi:hypothetical protein
MTRQPKPKQWVLSRETQLESGEHHIDALDSVPIRLCNKKHISGAQPFSSGGANAEGDEQ